MKPYHPTKILALISAFTLASTAYNSARAQAQPVTVQADEAPVQLSPFEVSESAEAGYGATNTTTASRVAQAYIDVPQTINVFTSEYIKDFNINDERALLQDVPNMLLGFDIYNSRVIRATQVNATYVNGLEQSGAGGTNRAQPMQFFDRVEIVKGPTSAAFGVGEPGGIINYVSKTPEGINRTDMTFGVGDYQNYKFSLDTQGVSQKDKRLSYRTVVFWDQGNYRVPVWFHKGAGVQIALKYDLDRNTTLQLITSYADTLDPADNNLSAIWANKTLYTVWRSLTGDAYPALPNTPHNPGNTVQDWAGSATLLSKENNPNPPWGGYNQKTFEAEGIIDHRFNEHIDVRDSFLTYAGSNTYNFSEISSLQSNPTGTNLIYPNGYPPGLYTDIARTYLANDAHGMRNDLDILVDYNFGSVDSKTLAGGAFGQDKSDNITYQPAEVDQAGNPILSNIYNPSRVPMGDPVNRRLYEGASEAHNFNYNYYVQEEAHFFNERVILSAAWIEGFQNFNGQDFYNHTSYSSGHYVNNKGTPRYSVTIKPTKWLSVYGLYSKHLDPTTQIGKYFIVLGTPDAATRAKYGNFGVLEANSPSGTLVEGGIKGTFLDGRLTFSADIFHEINSGQVFGRVVEADYDSSGKQVLQIGQNLISGVNAHGYEWEIFGQATPRLTFLVNYGQTKGHYPAFADGMPHWWAQAPGLFYHGKYDFGDLHGNGFYVTFGGQYFWGYWNYEDPYTWFNAGQYSFDGGIGFRWNHGRQSIYANMNNFTNQMVVVGNEDNVPWTVLPHEQAFITYNISF